MRPAVIRILIAVVAATLVLPGTARAATATTTTLTADRTIFQYHREVTFTVAVDPIPDGGIAVLKIRDFENDVVVYRSGALNPETGRVAFKVKMSTDLPPIEYTATATFLGTAAFDRSVSDPLTIKVNPNSTDTQLDIGPLRPFGAIVPGGDAQLRARVLGARDGFVRFSETTSGSPVVLATVKLTPSSFGTQGFANHNLADLTEGEHVYLAEFLGSMTGQPSSQPMTVAVDWSVTTRLSLSPPDANPVQQHHNVIFRFDFRAPYVGFDPTGTIELIYVETGETVDTASTSERAFKFMAPSLGWHSYRAVYSGDEHFAASTSHQRSVRIVPDSVDAYVYQVGGTFWPRPRDGIADEFTFAGYRYERASVKIRIFAPNGVLIETHRIGGGRGAFEWSWDGRDDEGRVRAEGAYRAVQEVFDSFGTRLRLEGVVQLSYGTPPAF